MNRVYIVIACINNINVGATHISFNVLVTYFVSTSII